MISLSLLATVIATPFVGYLLTSEAIDRDSQEPGGQMYGGLIQLLIGIVLMFMAIGVFGFLGAVAGGISLARHERPRWSAVLGLIGCGLSVGMVLVLFVMASHS